MLSSLSRATWTSFTVMSPSIIPSWSSSSSQAHVTPSTSWNTNTGQFPFYSFQPLTHTFCIFRSPTHDPSIDTFRVEFLLAPCFILALIFNYSFKFTEILWSFSIFLESVAILPQLFMLQRTGEAETITTHYLAALGIYRTLYIPNWIYRCVVTKKNARRDIDYKL